MQHLLKALIQKFSCSINCLNSYSVNSSNICGTRWFIISYYHWRWSHWLCDLLWLLHCVGVESPSHAIRADADPLARSATSIVITLADKYTYDCPVNILIYPSGRCTPQNTFTPRSCNYSFLPCQVQCFELVRFHSVKLLFSPFLCHGLCVSVIH